MCKVVCKSCVKCVQFIPRVSLLCVARVSEGVFVRFHSSSLYCAFNTPTYYIFEEVVKYFGSGGLVFSPIWMNCSPSIGWRPIAELGWQLNLNSARKKMRLSY